MRARKRKEFGQYIVADPEICHGQLTFRGTRIMVKSVLEMLAKGWDWDRISAAYDGLVSHAAIAEVLLLAGEALARKTESQPMEDHFDPSILQYLPQYVDAITNPDSWIKQADELLTAASMLKPTIRKEWETLRTTWEEAQTQYKGKDPLPSILKSIPLPLSVKFQRVYFLLAAFAIENICKAAIVQREHPSIKRGSWQNRRIPKTLRDHNLIGLIERMHAKININQTDEDLLRRLTRHAVWAGRYPVPVELTEAKYTEQFRDGEQYGIAYFYKDDLDRIETLISKIRRHLGL